MKIKSEKTKSEIESQSAHKSQELRPVLDFFLIDQIAVRLRDEGKTASETERTLQELGFSHEQIALTLRHQYNLK